MFACGHIIYANGQFYYHLFSKTKSIFFQLSVLQLFINFGTRFVIMLSEINKKK